MASYSKLPLNTHTHDLYVYVHIHGINVYIHIYTHTHCKTDLQTQIVSGFFFQLAAPFPCLQLQPCPRPALESHSGLLPLVFKCPLRPPGLCHGLLLPGTLCLHPPFPFFFLVSLSSDITSSRNSSLLHLSDFTGSLTHHSRCPKDSRLLALGLRSCGTACLLHNSWWLSCSPLHKSGSDLREISRA